LPCKIGEHRSVKSIPPEYNRKGIFECLRMRWLDLFEQLLHDGAVSLTNRLRAMKQRRYHIVRYWNVSMPLELPGKFLMHDRVECLWLRSQKVRSPLWKTVQLAQCVAAGALRVLRSKFAGPPRPLTCLNRKANQSCDSVTWHPSVSRSERSGGSKSLQ
jgi:hypothetical protein